MKKYTLPALLLGTLFSLSVVSATSVPVSTGVIGDVAPDEASEGCTALTYNLTYKKSKDANTNGEVSDLQYFLQDQGLLTAEPNGIFGPSTLRAVKYFQKKNGFITSGYVGPMTRAKIKEISCNGGDGSISIAPSVPVACTMEYRSCADGSAMPRDSNCKWREDKCIVKDSVKIHVKIKAEPNEIYEGDRTTISWGSSGSSKCLMSSPSRDVSNESVNTYGDYKNVQVYKNDLPIKLTCYDEKGNSDSAELYLKIKKNETYNNPAVAVKSINLPFIGIEYSNLEKYSEVDVVSVKTGKVVHDGGLIKEGGSGVFKIEFRQTTLGSEIPESGYYFIRSGKAVSGNFYIDNKIISNNPPVSVEAHGPNYNAMSCSNPAKTGLSSGQVACYGIWDYGNEFGGDPDMCPPYGYSSSQTGCKVTTKACQSGQAVATRVVNPTSMDVNSSDIVTFATNLKSSKEAVKQQIPTLWEYTCTGDTIVISPNTVSVTLADPVLVLSSPVSQLVIGGSNFGIATFKLKTQANNTTVKSLRFTTVGADAITSITVQGNVFPVINNSANITGLSIPVGVTGTDIPVTVQFSGFQNSTSGGGLTQGLSSVSIILDAVEIISNDGVPTTKTTSVSSNSMTLVASKPVVSGMNGSANLLSGLQKIGEFTVSADVNGPIAVSKISLIVSKATSGSINISNVKISDDNGATSDGFSNVVVSPVSGQAFDITFPNGYQISAGQSKTFNVWANISGDFGPVGTSLLAVTINQDGFKWVDIVGGYKEYSGKGLYNFPTTSYKLRNNTQAEQVQVIMPVCKVVDIYAKSVPGYVYSNLYIKTSNLVATSGLPIGITGTGSWDNLTFTKDSITGDLIASQTMNSTGVSYVLGMKNAVKLVQNGSTICESMNSSVASSQSTVLPTVLGATASCVDIPRNMHRGAESSFVTTLQKFLQSKGLLTEITGFYGDKTIEAVKDYQGSKGLPVTGMVYDATRESIKGETCQ